MTNINIVGGQFTSNRPYLLRALYEWILDNDGTPFLLVDATKSNVQVPLQHVKDGQIVLNATPGAIQGWFVDNAAISFSARFSGKAQNIFIPMNSLLAIYAQENGMGMAFPDETDDGFASPAKLSDDKSQKVKQKKLKVVKSESSGKKKESHLKIIK